jgi:hypothetical protein
MVRLAGIIATSSRVHAPTLSELSGAMSKINPAVEMSVPDVPQNERIVRKTADSIDKNKII